MSKAWAIALIIIIPLVMCASLYLQGVFSSRAKRNLRCLAFKSQDIFLDIKSKLDDSSIWYSLMMWSPNQTAYNQPGAAQRSPSEIWVQKDDLEKVKKLIESKYKIEDTGAALIIV